ncbi:hypothetical protein FHS29_005965 [Saccharothrix tamanrassetensis]|uniref:Uncharacterized protein n=1 Tax=Saccharothrix tamanrassetensis TaxID=1051531 RepID=A0A841CTR4_9PSEU|nr:hypothetical protein [Saccharothrix tamanrassetensis]MBB5959345.1 hypothetical protein [Saccharothrix tamanrassetensis]
MNRRAAGVALAVASAVTAVVATFLPLGRMGIGRGDSRFGYTTTGWSVTTEPISLAGFAPTAQFGVPIVIAAVLLVVAAALVFLPEHQKQAARYTAIGATGVLVGSVWTTFMVVSAWLSPSFRGERTPLESEYGAGLWLLVAAGVVAVVATVLLHAKPRQPAPEGPIVHRLVDDADTDTDTPPFGTSVPVLPAGYLEQPRESHGQPADLHGQSPEPHGQPAEPPGRPSETSGPSRETPGQPREPSRQSRGPEDHKP